MSLTDLLEQGPRPAVQPAQDRVLEAVSKLPANERQAFNTLIMNPQYSAVAIAKALQGLGVQVGSSQVVYLRKKLREGKAALELD